MLLLFEQKASSSGQYNVFFLPQEYENVVLIMQKDNEAYKTQFWDLYYYFTLLYKQQSKQEKVLN